MTRVWQSIGRAIVGRARLVGLSVLLVTVFFSFGLTRLGFETSQASLVSPSSDVYKVNAQYQQRFGGQAMFTLYTGPVEQLFSDTNLPRLRALERELRATGDFHAVLGPLTALQFARNQLTVLPDMLAGASARAQAAAPNPEAKAAAKKHYDDQIAGELARLSQTGNQRLDNPAFVEFLMTEADGRIRPALNDNFIDGRHALLVVRMPGNASIAREGELSVEMQAIVDRHPMEGFTALTTGSPALLKEINDYLRSGMATLGALAAVVMLAILWLVFRARWRLLSLAVVSVGLVWAFGALGYLGVPLSMVTISGLPILLGLGVDFAIQTHNRFEEESHTGRGAPHAVDTVMARMAPPLTISMAAAVAGFLALQVSEVPMIKDLGVLLGVGMVAMVVEAIIVVTWALRWVEQRHPTAAGEVLPGRIDRMTQRATGLAPRWAIALAATGLLVGGAGLIVEGKTPIQTDPEAWVGAGSASVEDLTALRSGTGYSTELGLSIDAADVTNDKVVAWIDTYARREVAAHPNALVHATSLPTLVSAVTGATPTGHDVEQLLSVAPRDVVKSFISSDGRHTNLIFPIANLSLQAREDLLDSMVADLDPPPGVTASPAGLVVLGIELVNNLEANRQVLTLAALGLVTMWLLLVYRRPVTALLPLVPVTMAVGASALAVNRLGLELTPLTTVSGPLAIAITTEFSVLLMSRYLEERATGADADQAVDRAALRIGRAFLASGLALLGGFVVLAFSPMPLLVDFGVVVALDVALALVSVLVVLPPLLRWTSPWISVRAPKPDLVDLTESPEGRPRIPETSSL